MSTRARRPTNLRKYILALALLSSAPAFASASHGCKALLCNAADEANWESGGRTFAADHYSPLSQIDKDTVSRLKLSWFYDLPAMISAQSTPVEADGVVYVAVGLSRIYALDAITGRELWRNDPKVAEAAGPKLREAWGTRGLSYGQGKVYVGTQDGRLMAINAKNGVTLWSVDTTQGRDDGRYITGAPTYFNGKVIVGHGGADYAPIRGYVTTYDAETGRQLWRFYTVPGNPSLGFEDDAQKMAARTWTGEWWKFGGGGTVWNAITYDPQYDRVYIGVGNGQPWNRKIRSPGGGDNLFLSSIVALDAGTGKYIWHYQTTPGESWDYTSTMDITLTTLPIKGKPTPVILHAPKNGFFYVINRRNGKLISAEPFVPNITWASRVDKRTGRPIEKAESRSGTGLAYPGSIGAHGWMPMSFSPKTSLTYIPVTYYPGVYNDQGIDISHWATSKTILFNTGYNDFGTEGIPAPERPMGGLVAWDAIEQKARWLVPRTHGLNGGIASTAGDLIFEGIPEGRLEARSATTGKLLWSYETQNGVIGAPIVYSVGGREYVALVVGYGGPPANLGAASAQENWPYESQKRRVLGFALDGKAALPPQERQPPVQPIADGTMDVDPAKSMQGAKLYNSVCFTCHGLGAVAGGAAPDLRASAAVLSPGAFRAVVYEGTLEGGGMPKFPEFSESDLDALRHFIRDRAQKDASGATQHPRGSD